MMIGLKSLYLLVTLPGFYLIVSTLISGVKATPDIKIVKEKSGETTFLSVSEREAELEKEALMQYDRLGKLISGELPQSKFAVPEHVYKQDALIFSSDRDPLDVVLRRTRALWNDLSNSHAEIDLRSMEQDLVKLEKAAKEIPPSDKEARKSLYLKTCYLRRLIAFSNPLLDFDRILFIEHKKNGNTELGGDHMAGQYYGIHATKGEGLFILENSFGKDPKPKNVIKDQLADGAYLSPELSFDGKKILFAYTEAAGYIPEKIAEEDKNGFYNYSGLKCSFTEKNAWHIYSVDTEGADLKQLTSGVYNDFDPCFLPNGKITFISDRRGGFGRCHKTAKGGAPWFTYTLHRMNDDGSRMERLSHHETCEWQPSIMNNGMIVYTRWDYVDRGSQQAQHPWTTMPDGRDPRSIHGNYPRKWQDRPCMELEIRAIPDSPKLIAVAAAHHGQSYGSIIVVDPTIEDDDALSQVKLITPDERFPESEYGYFCRNAAYATPWPLSENYYLCVFGYSEPVTPYHKNDETKSVENYGIYLLDAFGNIELIYRNPDIACLSPIPLKARPVPPVMPDIVQPMLVNLDQKRLNLDRPEMLESAKLDKKDYKPATVMIMDVKETMRGEWPENTKIKELRVIQVLPKSNPGRNNPAIGYGIEKNARFVLGTIPVEEDGSVNFYLPPYIPVYFQVLDENGAAVESMRSDTYVAEDEKLSCIGCHENKQTAPRNRGRLKAMQRAPSVLKPEVDGAAPFSYPRLVQPVLDKHCVACHAKHPESPVLSGKIDKEGWSPSYRNLQPFAFYYRDAGFTLSKTYPGKFGARASKLYRLLKSGHQGVKMTSEEMRRITLWLDCNSDFYGTYENIAEQQKGECISHILE